MTSTRLILASAAASLALASSPAFASEAVLTIQDFIGTITVETSPGAALRVTQKSNSGSAIISENREGLMIDGRVKKPDGDDCKGYFGNISWSFSDKKESKRRMGGYKDLDDYPNITISGPTDLHLVIKNSIPFAEIGDIGSADVKLSHCGRLSAGDISGLADVRITGSGDFSAGDIGSLNARVTGSGDLEFGRVGEAVLVSKGSGSIEFDSADDNVTLTTSGSSDVEIGDISGKLSLTSSGSSDIDIEEIGNGLIYSGSGSGDFNAETVNGDVDISLRGSGDVDVEDGEAQNLTISASGSSDVRFGGSAVNAYLTARGSSDISVGRVTGVSEQKTSGSADIDVNN